MVLVVRNFSRDGRSSYRRTEVRVTDDRYLEPPLVDGGAEPLKIADRYAAGRPRNN